MLVQRSKQFSNTFGMPSKEEGKILDSRVSNLRLSLRSLNSILSLEKRDFSSVSNRIIHGLDSRGSAMDSIVEADGMRFTGCR
jgi:hypothetical protein